MNKKCINDLIMNDLELPINVYFITGNGARVVRGMENECVFLRITICKSYFSRLKVKFKNNIIKNENTKITIGIKGKIIILTSVDDIGKAMDSNNVEYIGHLSVRGY